MTVRRFYGRQIWHFPLAEDAFLVDVLRFVLPKLAVRETKEQNLLGLSVLIGCHENVFATLLIGFASDLNLRVIKLSLKNKIYHIFNI